MKFLPLRFLLPALLSFCTAFGAGAEVIRIGAVYPMSGAGAWIGEGNRIGAAIAVDLINERGGIDGKRLALFIEDSQTEPRVGVSGFKKLVEVDKLQVVMTSLTSVGMAIRPLAEQAKVLMFAESTHPDLVKGHTYVLRNFYTADVANDQIVALFKKLGVSRIAVLHAEEEWGEAAFHDLERRVGSAGFQIVAQESFAKSATDLKPQLLRIKEKNPELIYIIGLGTAAGRGYQQARELRLKQQFAGFVVCGQSNLFEPAKAALEGAYSVEAALDVESAPYQKLAARFAARYPKRTIDQQVVIGFDAVNIIAEALEHVPYSGREIRDYILKKKTFQGASGKIEFAESGDSRRPMRLIRVEGGVCKPLS